MKWNRIAKFVLLVAAMAGCRRPATSSAGGPGAVTESSHAADSSLVPSAAGSASQVPTQSVEAESGSGSQGLEAGSEAKCRPPEGFELPVPPTEPFVSNADYPECLHPGVSVDCEEGWCRIPAGCFIWGSPEWEPNRAFAVEDQGQVTLTRSFEIMQHEVTVQQWQDAGFEALFSPVHSCTESTCPVARTTWYQVAEYANALSLAHNPPLEPCYVLSGCKQDIPNKYKCEGFELAKPTIYECEGYRMPTGAEWQYAARAGTTTSYYSGNISLTQMQIDNAETSKELCEPVLDPIAWYANNSGGEAGVTHPVGQKLPNAWGLYDTLGNAAEWTHQYYDGTGFEFPATDPRGELGSLLRAREARGGRVTHPAFLRVTNIVTLTAEARYDGFRLVRTLP